jgi:hypothetical protein
LTDAANEPGHVRCTASWIVSVPDVRCCIAVGHVADEFVMICSDRARSYQALCRMPW